jgi:hypothetical protein
MSSIFFELLVKPAGKNRKSEGKAILGIFLGRGGMMDDG